jgi:aspartyl/asparaginyl-tRNA synthetase
MSLFPGIPHINTKHFDFVATKLRKFFKSEGFLEGFMQNQLAALNACEDPATMTVFPYSGVVFPLNQSNQMRLEYDLMKHPEYKGVFCWTSSYRQEPDPVPGRHDLAFPMFEFEFRGNMIDLLHLLQRLITFLGFKPLNNYVFDYNQLCTLFNTDTLTNGHESMLEISYGPVAFIQHFPSRTSPFFNMKQSTSNPDLYHKIDVIIGGIETIGSAERESNVDIMRHNFETISNGEYAKSLYSHLGKDRVLRELDEYFSLPMCTRSGGGIGVTRLIKAMLKYGLIPDQ